MSETILVCDDEELIRWSLAEQLRGDGYNVVEAENGKQCLEQVASAAPSLVFLDLKMPELDGMSVLRALRDQDNDLPVIVITAHGGVESAIEATKLGATAYLPKPFDLREASLAARRALDESRLRREVYYLRTRTAAGYGEIVGESAAMRRLYDTLRRLEQIDTPTVLIQGESGTGKDLVARAIHSRGPRRNRPFMEIDCTALPEPLMESELFGHERGAFTDAKATKRGLFEAASGGILFLDEIGELPVGMQSKLLRALENRKFRRVGGVADIPLDAAIIAATNRDLRAEVKAARFREDLYFRLNVVPIQVPSLRDRREDIPALVHYFLDRFNRAFGRDITGVSGRAMERLVSWRWPGNVRELRNVVERTVILLDHPVIDVGDLPSELRGEGGGATGAGCPFILPDEGVDLEQVDRGLTEQALHRTGGNQSAAARLLGISRYALRYRMEKFDLK
ncbi:MAG: sigma-54-dependent Fis family transcriptional regulator [Deltaproteobacteria bacterium]|nr:sigma-54-dependent Fis family transcriptional regulator [Deltaproteobacteria bacterium]